MSSGCRPPLPHVDAVASRVTARDLMRTDLVAVDRLSSLGDASRLLEGEGSSDAPVIDSSGRVVGVVTLRALLEGFGRAIRGRARRRREGEPNPCAARDDGAGGETECECECECECDVAGRTIATGGEELVGDVMTGDVPTVRADASLAEVTRAMRRHRGHRVVVEERGEYVGLIEALATFDLLLA